MRLFEFEADTAQLKQALAECKPWFKTVKDASIVVYRGLKPVPTDPWFVNPIRTDRTSRDSTTAATTIYNRAIAKRNGKANRSNSAFVTSSKITAGDFYGGGQPWVFVPQGPFNYTWHTQWNDWYSAGEEAQELIFKYSLQQDIAELILDSVEDRFPDAELSWIDPLDDTADGKVRYNWYDYTIDYDFSEEAELYFGSDADMDNTEFTIDVGEYSWVNMFDTDKLAGDLLCDQKLNEAISKEHEIMISAKAGVYIKPEIFFTKEILIFCQDLAML